VGGRRRAAQTPQPPRHDAAPLTTTAVDETLKAKLASSRGAALFACALLTVATGA